jgi:hypothetical protein
LIENIEKTLKFYQKNFKLTKTLIGFQIISQQVETIEKTLKNIQIWSENIPFLPKIISKHPKAVRKTFRIHHNL